MPYNVCLMKDKWKIEDRGPTSNAAAMEALTCGWASAPNQYVCTNKRTGEVKTLMANDRWEAMEKLRKEEFCAVGH